MNRVMVNRFLLEQEDQYNFSISVCHEPCDHCAEAFYWRSREKRPAASLIKLFLLGTLAQGIATREYHENDVLLVSRSVGGSGIIKYMKVPATFSLGDLIYAMLVYSDNTAANALLSLAPLDAVNRFAASLGANDTKMNVPMMPTSTELQVGPNVTTADDVARFYRGVVCGFPEPVHPRCDEICRRFLLPTGRSLKEVTRFFFSAFNRRGLWRVIKQSGPKIPSYLRATFARSAAERIRVPNQWMIGRKPATGRSVYHDSCLYRSATGPSSLVVMIESTQADFTRPRSPQYKAARHICSELGRKFITE